MEKGLTKNRVIAELTRSPHGDLDSYLPIGLKAAQEDSEFFDHLIAWNQKNGQIRDAKVALPVIALKSVANDRGGHSQSIENSLGHMAMLDPRNLVRAVRFSRGVKIEGHGRKVIRLVQGYLRYREGNPKLFERAVLQHRQSMKELYALCHVKPGAHANDILFKGKKVGVFKDVAALKDMSPQEAAGVILRKRIPFLVAQGALGAKAKDPVLVMAMIEQMSPTELVTNTKMLEKLGIKTVPELRAAYEQAMIRAAESTKATLKTTQAAAVVSDPGLKQKLQGLQEKQIDKLGGIEGSWLVLGDKSGSMAHAIEAARHVAATLARMVKGEVHLVFFDTSPRYIDATGKTYDALLAETGRISAVGGTSVGCGVQYALDKSLQVDGIAIVSDGGENTQPWFAATYKKLCVALGKDVPVYLYDVPGDANALSGNCREADVDLQTFDLRQTRLDYYSLPNLVQTMRASRYSLVDEIMQTPLVTLDEVFKKAA